MKTPHKHAALIKAWADGAIIQVKREDGQWYDCEPLWFEAEEYRLKFPPNNAVNNAGSCSVMNTPERTDGTREELRVEADVNGFLSELRTFMLATIGPNHSQGWNLALLSVREYADKHGVKL